MAAFDRSPPRIDSVTATSGLVGDELGVTAATARDTWSGVTLTWDFGDGEHATGAAPKHRFAAAGTYKVSVTATDGVGRTATATRTLAIDPLPVIATPTPVPGAPDRDGDGIPDATDNCLVAIANPAQTDRDGDRHRRFLRHGAAARRPFPSSRARPRASRRSPARCSSSSRTAATCR